MDTEPITSVDELIDLLLSGAGAHEGPGGGEQVDQLQHALQCAHELAGSHPADVELQVAGLVHDIGHLLAPGDDAAHGSVGADAVRWLLGDRVARLVEHHVPAKRYLVTVDPAYRDQLSPTSVRTLGNQGGAMPADELVHHRALPDWDAGLDLRRADEAAKIPGRLVPGIEHWHSLLITVAAGHREH